MRHSFMKKSSQLKKFIVLGAIVIAYGAVAAPASALVAEGDGASEPAPREGADRVAEDPAAPIVEPGQLPIQPTPTVVIEPVPAKVDAANFGVGWPAAVAVAVALLAVLAMALTWKREESW